MSNKTDYISINCFYGKIAATPPCNKIPTRLGKGHIVTHISVGKSSHTVSYCLALVLYRPFSMLLQCF